MERDPRALLWDVGDSADRISRFIRGRDRDDYLGDEFLRSAVERQFTIIGEALGRLAKIAPELATRIPELKEIVAFRNLLIHGYAVVDDATVWRIIKEDLPALRDRVAALLTQSDPG